MNHLHWLNHKHKADHHPKDGTWTEDQKEDLTSVRLPHWGYPHLINVELEGGLDRGTTIHQSDTCILSRSSCTTQDCEDVSLTDWPLCIVHGGVVTVIQEFDMNLHTPLPISHFASQSLNSSCKKLLNLTPVEKEK